jgi:tricorn protease-like protein
VVDLSSSSDEGDLIIYVSWNEEFARRLFGDLNRDVLGLSDDGKIIILSDSDEEEEEVREEKTTDTEDVAISTAVNLVSTASIDDTPTG